MRYLSVCSGIEAASCAWHPLGWTPVAFSEIEAFPSAVLAHHYPDTPNWGDMSKFKEWPDADVDVLVGGTPCQSFSVAGLRKGLADPRGNLMLTYLAIADRYRPTWLVWENVPGVLSSNGGRDFGTFLGGLGELGYGFAYRVLDAQFFGLAQRRRRVFVVGCVGNWRRAAAVLFERHSLLGHPAPRRETGEEVAGTFTARAKSGGWGQDPNLAAAGYMRAVSPTLRAGGNKTGGDRPPGTDVDTCESLIPVPHADISPALKARDSKGPSSDGDGEGFDSSEDGTGRGTPLVPVAFAHQAAGAQTTLGYDPDSGTTQTLGANQTPAVVTACEIADTLSVGANQTTGFKSDIASVGMQVRRLTPLECSRLQGFPDNYLDVPYRGKPAADGPRYKALGNSMAVPVMTWIGRRIQMVSEIAEVQKCA